MYVCMHAYIFHPLDKLSRDILHFFLETKLY